MPLFQTLPPDAATMPSEARIGFQTAAKNRRFSAGFIIMPRPSGQQGSDWFAGRRAVPCRCAACTSKHFPTHQNSHLSDNAASLSLSVLLPYPMRADI
ncbi:TPA: hypothetical protein ACXIQE_000846 [Neisseria meningitidis]